jgi:hypothetical protein
MTPILQDTYVDKSTWPRGEWDKEPDKLHWIDEETNLDCLIVRGPSGGLCGYVGVDSTHPAFGKDYSDVDVSVHGGLTYAALCQEDGKICHVPQEGRSGEIYWLGFDCGHLGDLTPQFSASSWNDGGIYRSLAYVVNQVTGLARQLKEMK